jgi:hypothetical protein
MQYNYNKKRWINLISVLIISTFIGCTATGGGVHIDWGDKPHRLMDIGQNITISIILTAVFILIPTERYISILKETCGECLYHCLKKYM